MKKNYISIIILILQLFFFLNILSKQERIVLEAYENRLVNIIEKLFTVDELKNSNINEFSYKKTVQLTFKEACKLYILSLKNRNYKLQRQNSLERMYSMSPDSRLSELILWNLAMIYENDKKAKQATEMFSHFRKLFPGSRYYWACRIKEIENSAATCFPYYKDSSQIENVITLCKQYIFDIKEANEPIDNKMLHIMNLMYLEIIRKEIYIITSYYNKFFYMNDPLCYYSATQRILSLTEIIFSAIDYELALDNDLRNKEYQKIFKEIQKNISEFQKIHGIIIPDEKDFKNTYDQNFNYINKNIKRLGKDIDKFIKTINILIEKIE